jgi:molybdopterin molybdotransferase
MLSFEDARKTILAHVSPLGAERVPLPDAPGRVLAEDAVAPWDMPQWDHAAMDGYAVRSGDCGAIPRTLAVTGFIPAGRMGDALEPGGALRIMTGAPLPPGCDAVVPLEDTDNGRRAVTLLQPVREGQHIRRRGNEIREGSVFAASGTPVGPPLVGMLASFGMVMAPVRRRPVVAIVTSGDELIEPGRSPGPGEVINGNALALAAAVREAGGIPRVIGIARDNRVSHRTLLEEGLGADVLVTSAGVSAGDRDFVRDVLDELGAGRIFWRVAMRPGGPSAFYLHDSTPVFCLPGNPQATLITFEEFVRPALLRMQGLRQVLRPLFRAVLRDGLAKRPGSVQIIPVRLERGDGTWYASPDLRRLSSIDAPLSGAKALAVLPFEAGSFDAGDGVEVHFWGPLADLV